MPILSKIPFIPLVIICLYVLLCLVYAFLLARQKKSWQYGLFAAVLSLALPMVGFVFLWICDAFAERKISKTKSYSELYLDDDFNPDNFKLLQNPNYEKESNYVSMEEALKIGTYDYRRKMIMQLLEEDDTMQYVDILQRALENEDSETTHYASTVIMEMQRKVQEELMEAEVQFEKDVENIEIASRWEALLFKVLCSNLYDDFNKRRYFIKYVKVNDKLLESELPEEKFLIHRIHVMLMEKNYTGAQELCNRYLNCYPRSEDAILYQLETYIQAKDSEGMKKFLETLSSRPVILTQKTLEYIRIFREG